MHKDHFRFLSFHPPTPSNIIASKWNLSLETFLSSFLLLEFLFPKISSSSRKARQNKLDEERKKRGEGIGNGEETGVYNWLVLAHPPPPVLHPGFMGKSSTAGLLLFLRRFFFFIRKRFLAIPFLDLTYLFRSIDLEWRSRFTRRDYAEIEIEVDERKLTLNFVSLEVN